MRACLRTWMMRPGMAPTYVRRWPRISASSRTPPSAILHAHAHRTHPTQRPCLKNWATCQGCDRTDTHTLAHTHPSARTHSHTHVHRAKALAAGGGCRRETYAHMHFVASSHTLRHTASHEQPKPCGLQCSGLLIHKLGMPAQHTGTQGIQQKSSLLCLRRTHRTLQWNSLHARRAQYTSAI